MGESSCCTADELVLVLPGIAPARVGVALTRYTPGGTSSPRAAIGLDELTSPLASQSCRSTRPGCEQRSGPAGAMGESSCCIADELVLVPPGIALARVGVARVRYTPVEHASWGRRAPAPGANSVARLVARWVSSPAAPRT